MNCSFLSVACACGAKLSAPCPTVGDIPAVQESFVGWDHDERGFIRCPECSAAGVIVERERSFVQSDLFGVAA